MLNPSFTIMHFLGSNKVYPFTRVCVLLHEKAMHDANCAVWLIFSDFLCVTFQLTESCSLLTN